MWPSEIRELCAQFTGRVSVRRERINSQGYLSDGTYFGVGAPLYFIQDEEGIWDDYVRASCRAEAVEIARDRYPVAKIRN